MNKLIQQIGAIFLAMLIFLSTVTFTVDVHICAGSIVDVSFVQEALSCSSSLMGEISEEAHKAMRNMGCCDDLQFHVEGQDELQHSFLDVQVDNPVFIASSAILVDFDWVNIIEDPVLFTSYLPPPLIQDVQVLHQTFLL